MKFLDVEELMAQVGPDAAAAAALCYQRLQQQLRQQRRDGEVNITSSEMWMSSWRAVFTNNSSSSSASIPRTK
jgi:hypothetical protein